MNGYRTGFLFLAHLLTASAFAPPPIANHNNNNNAAAKASSATATAAAAVTETPPSPLTVWGETIPDIRSLQQRMRKQTLPEFGPELSAADVGIDPDDKEAQLEYFRENASSIKQKMEDHGAVVLRDFKLMKDQEGFQQFYAALGMKICQDPLQSVSARPTADGKKDSPVYEAVNKESRKNFFIGERRKRERGETALFQANF